MNGEKVNFRFWSTCIKQLLRHKRYIFEPENILGSKYKILIQLKLHNKV